MLDEPLQMANPRKAFTENPWVDADGRPRLPRPGHGVRRRAGERRRQPAHRGPLGRLRPRATTSSTSARGASIRVGDEEWEIDGFGLRDHSWGPRFWQAPWYYRWLTMNFGDDAGFVVSVITARDGSERVGGVAFEDGEVPPPRPGDDRDRLGRRRQVPRGDAHRREVGRPHLRDHRQRAQPHPAAEPAHRPPRASSSSPASPRA